MPSDALTTAIGWPFESKNDLVRFEEIRRVMCLASKTPRFSIRQVTELMNQVTDKLILKDLWPSLPFLVIEHNLSNVSFGPNIPLIRRLVYEFNYDVNAQEVLHGTILHMFCHYHDHQDSVCQFLTQLRRDGFTINLEIQAFLEYRGQTRPLKNSGFKLTPLQYAIEMRCYKLAHHLITMHASVDNLLFEDQFLQSYVDKCDRSEYLQLIQVLLYLNVFSLEQVHRSKNIPESVKAQLNRFIASRTLVELSLRVIRKYPYKSTGRTSIDSFMNHFECEMYFPAFGSFFSFRKLNSLSTFL